MRKPGYFPENNCIDLVNHMQKHIYRIDIISQKKISSSSPLKPLDVALSSDQQIQE